MRVKCACGEWHEISPTGMALILDAYLAGDVQTIGHEGVQSLCFENAFTDVRIQQFVSRYPGNSVQFRKMGRDGAKL